MMIRSPLKCHTGTDNLRGKDATDLLEKLRILPIVRTWAGAVSPRVQSTP